MEVKHFTQGVQTNPFSNISASVFILINIWCWYWHSSPALDTRLTSSSSKGAFTLQLFTFCTASFFCVHVRVLHSAVSLLFVRRRRFSPFAFQMIQFTQLCQMYMQTFAHTASPVGLLWLFSGVFIHSSNRIFITSHDLYSKCERSVYFLFLNLVVVSEG